MKPLKSILWFLSILVVGYLAHSFQMIATQVSGARSDLPAVLTQIEETRKQLAATVEEAKKMQASLPASAQAAGEKAAEGVAKGIETAALNELNPRTHIERPIKFIKSIFK